MTDDNNTGLPKVQEAELETKVTPLEEGKVGPERIVHEKAERETDWGAFKVLSLAGALCGVMMWVAFSWVGQDVDVATLPGAVLGGLVSGWAIFALS